MTHNSTLFDSVTGDGKWHVEGDQEEDHDSRKVCDMSSEHPRRKVNIDGSNGKTEGRKSEPDEGLEEGNN